MRKFDTTLIVGDVDIDVTVEYDAVYQAAKLSGPPENCHEAEGELTLISCRPILFLPHGITNGDLERARVQQKARLEEEAWEDYHTREDRP